MSNLIQRLTGDISDGETKIPIHAFCGALNEFRRGKLTGSAIAAAFEMTASQITQAQGLKALIVAAPNRTEFMRVFKDLMYMGETGLSANYTSMSFINSRLQEEVTDQGGTLP